jgi:hypothetical protein
MTLRIKKPLEKYKVSKKTPKRNGHSKLISTPPSILVYFTFYKEKDASNVLLVQVTTSETWSEIF